MKRLLIFSVSLTAVWCGAQLYRPKPGISLDPTQSPFADIYSVTNVVLPSGYTGTIQIGTNTYTRKDFDNLALIPKGNYAIWESDLKTKWIGSAITGERLGGGKPNGLFDTKASDEQIGLRADGVVVWKKRDR